MTALNTWPERTLDEVCLKITDGAHRSPKSVVDGLPMSSVKDLSRFGLNLDTARRIPPDEYHQLVRQGCQPRPGDVLIAKDGATALDTVCEIRKPVETVLLSSVAILRPDPTQVTTSFLRYFLDSPTTRAAMKAAFTTGAAIPRVVLKDFKRAPIRVPPLETQRRIASILSAYDDLIENNTRRIAILEEMARGIYEEWFVRFRFPGHELDRPSWRNVQLGEIGIIQTGPFGSQLHQSDYVDDGVPVTMPKDIALNRIDVSSIARIPEQLADQLGRHRMRSGDIVYGRRGDIGRLCRCLDYVEPPWASCANRPTGAAGADFDLHIIIASAGSRSASRVPDSA